MTKTFWTKDWFTGVTISALCAIAALLGVFKGLERTAYDLAVSVDRQTPSDQIAVIAIDDQSIANLGRWPWSRDIHAQMIRLLGKAKAKIIGNTLLYTEPQKDSIGNTLSDLSRFYETSSLVGLHKEATTLKNLLDQAAVSLAAHSTGKPRVLEEREYLTLSRLSNFLTNASYLVRLPEDADHLHGLLLSGHDDIDRHFTQALREVGTVVLGIGFTLGDGRPDTAAPDAIQRHALQTITPEVEEGDISTAIQLLAPLREFSEAALALGHTTITLDSDGIARSTPLVINYMGKYYPALSLSVVTKYLNLHPIDIRLLPGEGITLGARIIPTDAHLHAYIHFYSNKNNHSVFPVDSFYDVLSGKINLKKYEGKIVLIGSTAQGVGESHLTPVTTETPPVLILANEISSILQGHTYSHAEWTVWIEGFLCLLVAIYLCLGLPHLKAGMAATITATLCILLITSHFIFMVLIGTWIPLMIPVVLLLIGHLALTTKSYLLTEKRQVSADANVSRTNRQLGLVLQTRGDLNAAFDKFYQCLPMDESLAALFYNLGLDFEHKLQYKQAINVYETIAEFKKDFRDIQNKMKRLKSMTETVVLGGNAKSGHSNGFMESGIEKPILGRYQIERELGRGAMGAVYLGRDPKIIREVAIKTLALSQEFEETELVEVKDRFFREAETAGRLAHPNIVTIYDVGEERQLAYIAMELLKGTDLSPYTRREHLLPVSTVLKLTHQVASALDYAHGQGVIHRDIKPANIMYAPETAILKVTDFGIARITDSSKTKTGMVMGTPSYMSPEQLSGVRVDGRSDLFSLGVMLYQLLTGELPFTGESMATLMHHIANAPHRDPRELCPTLPMCISDILSKALAKDPQWRYQTGLEMAKALAACAEQAAHSTHH